MVSYFNIDNKFIDLFSKYLEIFNKLENYSGDPSLFWSFYLQTMAEICSIDVGIIVINFAHENEINSWKSLAFYPSNTESNQYTEILIKNVESVAKMLVEKETALIGNDQERIGAVKINVDMSQCFALFYLGAINESEAIKKINILKFMNQIPKNYQMHLSFKESLSFKENFTNILDMMTLINSQDKFLPAAMTFCNEIAARYKCDRVSLGWFKRNYIRLQAMNNTDNFEKKMEIVQKLELVMEESIDQDAEIVYPSLKDSSVIFRDHEAFAKVQGSSFICSFPLRIDDKPIAVCTLERNTEAFKEDELRLLRLSLDQVKRKLFDLEYYDHWIGGLIVESIKKKLAKFLGFEHTWAKIVAILISLALAFIIFVNINYRVQANTILKSESVSYLSAPFDSRIQNVLVKVGEEVKKGQALLIMDQKDLLLEESSLIAEKTRYKQEIEKARATNSLADMCIAEALYNQSSAKLEITRYRLNQVIIKAPFQGVIIEGDLKEREGAPVKQGDVLFKVGKTENIFAELEVKEADIHNIKTSEFGEIALASRPSDKFKIKIFRIEYAAIPKKNGNIFLIHCNFPQDIPIWWRPGMTGVAKLNAGKKTLLWIFTHRTLDFLRLRLWW